MPVNSIKESGSENALALQVTLPSRSAGLVEERDDDDEPKHLAPVRVYSFDGVLLVVDRERLDMEVIASIVASATRDTESIYRAANSRIQISGNGYQVQLGPARDAGFNKGDRAPCHPATNMLVIAKDEQLRLAKDLVSLRQTYQ